MHFAREGYPIAGPFLIAGLFLVIWGASSSRYGWFWSGFILFLVGAILLAFFRDPQRTVPAEAGVIVAPADGRILLSESLPDGRKHIAIFLSVFNVHVNRAPVAGTVTSVSETPGKYFVASSDEAATGNARITVTADTKYGTVEWRQISGIIARKISCRLKAGDQVQLGERYGLIYFGSRMEVFLPQDAELVAVRGQRVSAGESIIAKYSRKIDL